MGKCKIFTLKTWMRKIKKIGWIVFFMQLTVFVSSAHPMPVDDSGTRSISLGYTSETFVSMELCYVQNLGIFQEKNLQIYGRVGFPLLMIVKNHSFDSWKIELGASTELVTTNKFIIIADTYLFLLHHEQVLGNFTPVGVNLCLTPAYHFTRGTLGFQVRWNQTLTTYISHSNYVKNTFTALSTLDNSKMIIHPRNGWYGFTGSHLDFGIEGCLAMGSRYMLSIDLGLVNYLSPYTGIFDGMMMGQVPFYLEVRLFYKL